MRQTEQFDRIYAETRDDLLRYLTLRTNADPEAEDLFQEIYRRFYDRLTRGVPVLDPRRYLFSVAKKVLAGYYRSSAKRKAAEQSKGAFVDPIEGTQLAVDKEEARKKCGFEEGKKYVIWCSHPSRSEKRFSLAQEAVTALNDPNVILYPVFDKVHDEVVDYMCAADVLLLTSVCEGSPNVIKEAMACNCPVVSTDVGDVDWVTGGIEGTIVVPYGDVEALRKGLCSALAFHSRTQGRERIKTLGLTIESVARKIKTIYDTL